MQFLIPLGGDVREIICNIKKGGKIVSISGIPNGRFAKENGFSSLTKTLLSIASYKFTKLEKNIMSNTRFFL